MLVGAGVLDGDRPARLRLDGDDGLVKLLLITAGSRGDVEPFVALAVRAAAEGHDVRVAAPGDHGVRTGTVDVASLGVSFSRIIEEQGASAMAALRSFRRVVRPTMRGVIVGAARAAADFRPDVVLYHPKVLSAPLIAAALDIPHVMVELVPAVTPTHAFPAAGTVTVSLGPLNRLTYGAASTAAIVFRRELDEASAVLGHRRTRRTASPTATFFPLSPALLARPDDWPDTVHLTGAWRWPDEPRAPDPVVETFTSAGPFLYAGFGSMASGNPVGRGRLLLDAARARGLRLLIATGLGGIHLPEDETGEDVLVVRSVDHDRVLPRAAAAVHHGGIGTVQAALRSGVASVIVPFGADQPFWGVRVHRRGLGPAPIPRRRLTTARLQAALDSVPTYRARVGEVAAEMAGEDGTGEALSLISALP